MATVFYFRFVGWLVRKVSRYETKKSYGDAGLYNRFDDVLHSPGLHPFSLLLLVVLYVVPFAAYLYIVLEVLPFSDGVRLAVLMTSLIGTWVVAVALVVRRIRRR